MISPTYFTFFAVFAVIAYLIVTDNSVAQYITLLSKIAVVEYQKKKWWLLNNPRNPIVKYLMWRRAMRTVKELEQEFAKRQ